jgi:methylmalonyl-CoA mutase N-terminal domain/subunit
MELLQIDETAESSQAAKLKELRAARDNARVRGALDDLRRVAEGAANTMPAILDCVRALATTGEICDALRDVFGTYQESSVL